MKILLKTYIILLLLAFVSCNESTNNEQAKAKTSEEPPQEITQQAAATAEKVIIATYQAATVYAARTDYQFETEEGEMLLIEGNVYDEKKIELPDNMLDDSEDIEGPPGANPALEGKKFKIYYNANGEVYKIELNN